MSLITFKTNAELIFPALSFSVILNVLVPSAPVVSKLISSVPLEIVPTLVPFTKTSAPSSPEIVVLTESRFEEEVLS